MDVLVSCRKCSKCLRVRRRLWQKRSAFEVRLSRRTWFCTFTIAPEHRVRFEIKASRTVGKSWDGLSEGKRFIAIYNEIGKEFTKYMKRLRKKRPALLVVLNEVL